MSHKQSVYVSIFTVLASLIFAGSLRMGTEYSVRNDNNSNMWMKVAISSQTPFAIDDATHTIYAHPNQDGVVTFDYGDMSVFSDEEYWRFDGVDFWGDENGSVVSLVGTRRGTLNYSYHSYSGWYGYTMTSELYGKTPYVIITTDGPDGEPLTLFWESIDAVTPNFDYLNLNYHVSLVRGTEDNRMPCENLPVHFEICGFNNDQACVIYDGGWQTTDMEGNVSFGSGSEEVNIRCSGPLDYFELTVTPINESGVVYQSYSYKVYEGRVDGDFKFFDGTFHLDVRDPCGNPVMAKVVLNGGPLYGSDAYYGYKITDLNGGVDFNFGSSGIDSYSMPVKILPLINLSGTLSQIVDDPAGLLTRRPLFMNGTVQFVDGAYSIKPDSKLGGLKLKLYRDGSLESTSDFVVKKTYTDRDKRTGRDRYKFNVPVTNQTVEYRVDAYLDDTDGNETLVGSVARDVVATVKPIDNRTLHFQYVPIEPEKSAGYTAPLEAYVEMILPAEVVYSYAPPLKPSLWPWEADIMRLTGWYRELERYRVSQNPAPDLVIGMVPPGGLNTYMNGTAAALSMDGYTHVILMDSSRIKSHHLLHEYMHTLGLPDNYGGTYPPPSASGYDSKGLRICNIPNTSPLYCAVMYDFAPVAWPTKDEYSTLISKLTESVPATAAASASASEELFAQAFPASMEAGEASEPSKVILISGIVEDSWYGPIITHRAPIFVDEGSVYAPHELAPGYFEGHGAQILDNGQVIADAYQTVKTAINGGYLETGSIYGMLNLSLPWQAGIDKVVFGTFDSGGTMYSEMYDCTVEFTPNTPQASWINVPADGDTLSGKVNFSFQASDVDPDSTLWAWFKISTDGGQSWQPVGNCWSIEPGQTTFSLDCTKWPSTTQCQVKLLVTDDGNTTALTMGTYTLEGYNPNPVFTCDTAVIEKTFNTDHPVIIPVTIRNEGYAMLSVALDSGTLPWWIKSETATSLSIPAHSGDTLFFIAEPNEPGSYNTQINLVTNDTQHSTVSIPVQLDYSPQEPAPEICWAGLASGEQSGDTIGMTSSMTILTRDSFGRDELEAYATVIKVSNGFEILAEKLPMETGGTEGMYSVVYPVDDELASETLAIEFDMVDPNTRQADTDGLISGAYDFSITLNKPNTPPEFTVIDPLVEEYDYITTGYGNSLDLSYSVEDLDGDPVYYMIHSYSDLPFEWDMEAGQLHCVIPILDKMFDYKVNNQKVELIAVDRFGAQVKAEWQLYISAYSHVNNRAYPYYSDTVLSGDIVPLKVFSFSALDGQYCRVEYRRQGDSTWILIGESIYDQECEGMEVPYGSKMTTLQWNTTALIPGQAYEVRYIDYWPGGGEDVNPPIVVFRKALTAGQITRIEAPSLVMAGQPFMLQVEVQNKSAHCWKMEDGYCVRPPAGADSLTGLTEITAPIDFAQVSCDGKVIYCINAVAPEQAGLYTTTWRPCGPDGFIGQEAGLNVQVVDSTEAAIPMDFNNDKAIDFNDLIILGSVWSINDQDPMWNPDCDLAPDGIIDLNDLAAFLDSWLECF